MWAPPRSPSDIRIFLSKCGCSAIGFDYDKGRMDTSVHPFTGGSHPTDVRITTRYSKDNWLEGIAGTVHEVRYIHIYIHKYLYSII